MRRTSAETIPGPETPALSEQERAARLQRLAARLFEADGLDRDALARVEQLTDDEH